MVRELRFSLQKGFIMQQFKGMEKVDVILNWTENFAS